MVLIHGRSAPRLEDTMREIWRIPRRRRVGFLKQTPKIDAPVKVDLPDFFAPAIESTTDGSRG